MKVTVTYVAFKTVDYELDEKYRPLWEIKNREFTNDEDDLANEMIESINHHFRQIDPDFIETSGMVNNETNLTWEW